MGTIIGEGITFDDVTFEYVPGTPVLKNVNLNVRAGSTVAVVGNSGGGKIFIAHRGHAENHTPRRQCRQKIAL